MKPRLCLPDGYEEVLVALPVAVSRVAGDDVVQDLESVAAPIRPAARSTLA